MTDTKRSFMAAIIERPGDDLTRLVCAPMRTWYNSGNR